MWGEHPFFIVYAVLLYFRCARSLEYHVEYLKQRAVGNQKGNDHDKSLKWQTKQICCFEGLTIQIEED